MLVSMSELGGATGRIAALVKHAQAGDEVILTQQGQQIARLVPVAMTPHVNHRRALMERVRASAAAKLRPGPDAAHSQDFLYDDDGLPA